MRKVRWAMKLVVYKGFDNTFLKNAEGTPLLAMPIAERKNVLKYDRDFRRKLTKAVSLLEDEDIVWATYEEYSFIQEAVAADIKYGYIQLIVQKNNLYPDSYPIEFDLEADLADEIQKTINGQDRNSVSEECKRFLEIYNSLIFIDGVYYASYYNYEYENDKKINFIDFYNDDIGEITEYGSGECNIFINGDIDSYLKSFSDVIKKKPRIIGVKCAQSEIARKIFRSLKAYCILYGINLVNFKDDLINEVPLEKELIDIARNDLHIPNFRDFRKIKFYKNPDIDKETVDISQAQIIQEIINQAENAYNDAKGNSFRDIFITASTGAGKSVMFQVPSVYLAKKYKKLTIIIEPVKALMQDQKENLNKNGYFRVETFNSDLISQVDKEAVLRRIKAGEVDLLYLSPETLLSYSLDTIVGDREIGLLIVDEAHIVTTWGVGFRPDYWYLGSYINMLRNLIQTSKGVKRNVHHFPICAFTATAINGGQDDSVGETITSLYMENPIKYIGYVRRNDISFDIKINTIDKKLGKSEYKYEKAKMLKAKIQEWRTNNEKTVVYYPYASTANELYKQLNYLNEVGVYTGKNVDEINIEFFNDRKRQTFEDFRGGKKTILFATKAFGMGIDVDDIKNIYHYAVTGNLCDYVQEIGRAARKKDMLGKAISEIFPNDFHYMQTLFGMSQIKQYQIRKVLEGVYNIYKSKNSSRNFLISPESFTYIFNDKNEEHCINKLKTCLMMLEKDFYDVYRFKVLISRPQGIFTKAFICIGKEDADNVLSSKYGKFINRIDSGRNKEYQLDGSQLSDLGDIYTIDLKSIWEIYYPDVSFPQFKYFYFNHNAEEKVMPEIIDKIFPRQKISIKSCNEENLANLRTIILDDFEYIANILYSNFKKTFFTKDDFRNAIKDRYKPEQAKIIANSLFELVDPKEYCIKSRNTEYQNKTKEFSGKSRYSLGNGNLKELMRKPIVKSKVMSNIMRDSEAKEYNGYMSLASDEYSNIALKLLSIFGYITYEIVGGKEPEIFIRLNDPYKVRSIVMGNSYSNSYVREAREKHDRDVKILKKFFNELSSDEERWEFIENYFLGYDLLGVDE